MLGAKIIRPDGVLEHAGILVTEGRRVILGLGDDPSAPVFGQPRSIDGVAPEAFAVRVDAWQKIGGMDESLGDVALDEFCARVIAGGGGILYDPNFTILLNEPSFCDQTDAAAKVCRISSNETAGDKDELNNVSFYRTKNKIHAA